MKRIVSLLLMTMVLTASCERPAPPVPEPEEEGGTVFSCVLPLVENGKTAWLPGDKILFHVLDSVSSIFTINFNLQNKRFV